MAIVNFHRTPALPMVHTHMPLLNRILTAEYAGGHSKKNLHSTIEELKRRYLTGNNEQTDILLETYIRQWLILSTRARDLVKTTLSIYARLAADLEQVAAGKLNSAFSKRLP